MEQEAQTLEIQIQERTAEWQEKVNLITAYINKRKASKRDRFIFQPDRTDETDMCVADVINHGHF